MKSSRDLLSRHQNDLGSATEVMMIILMMMVVMIFQTPGDEVEPGPAVHVPERAGVGGAVAGADTAAGGYPAPAQW